MARKKAVKNEVIVTPDFLTGLAEFDGPDDSDLWAGQYPYVQWNNKEKQWEFPLKHWAGTEIEQSHELIEVDHGEETEFGFLLDTINVSVVAWRYTWETMGDDGEKIYSLQPQFGNGIEWTKKYNFLCIIQETGDDEPAIITTKGYTGEYLYSALNLGRKRTLKLAQKLTGHRFPGYLFWVPLSAGGKQVVGKNDKKSAIYPPVSLAYTVTDMDDEGISNLLQSLYIGDDLKDQFSAYLYDEGQQWVNDVPQTPALPAGDVPLVADILPGGVLYLPDLSDKKPKDWIDCAMTIDGLFNHRSHASNAFAKVIRSKGLQRSSPADQWEAYRDDLETRFEDMIAKNEDIANERMLTG